MLFVVVVWQPDFNDSKCCVRNDEGGRQLLHIGSFHTCRSLTFAYALVARIATLCQKTHTSLVVRFPCSKCTISFRNIRITQNVNLKCTTLLATYLLRHVLSLTHNLCTHSSQEKKVCCQHNHSKRNDGTSTNWSMFGIPM